MGIWCLLLSSSGFPQVWVSFPVIFFLDPLSFLGFDLWLWLQVPFHFYSGAAEGDFDNSVL